MLDIEGADILGTYAWLASGSQDFVGLLCSALLIGTGDVYALLLWLLVLYCLN